MIQEVKEGEKMVKRLLYWLFGKRGEKRNAKTKSKSRRKGI